MTHPKLGFRQLPDPRDALYPLGAIMKETATIPVSKVWSPAPVNNQGDTSGCVGFSVHKLLGSEPMIQDTSILSPMDIYDEARENDEWPTGKETDSGTSVRAGLEVLRRHGLITAYFWGSNIDEVVQFLLTTGPVVLGVDWYNDCFSPNAKGVIHPTGGIVGGHAIFCYAADWNEKYVTLRNSWGPSWGRDGDCLLSFDDLDWLLRTGVAAAVREPAIVLP